MQIHKRNAHKSAAQYPITIRKLPSETRNFLVTTMETGMTTPVTRIENKYRGNANQERGQDLKVDESRVQRASQVANHRKDENDGNKSPKTTGGFEHGEDSAARGIGTVSRLPRRNV